MGPRGLLGQAEMSISIAWPVRFADGVASGSRACGLPQFSQTLECMQMAWGLAERRVLAQQVRRGPRVCVPSALRVALGGVKRLGIRATSRAVSAAEMTARPTDRFGAVTISSQR